MVSRAFQRALAFIFLIAWLSLGVQVEVLVGSRGLLPLGEFMRAVREGGGTFREFPTLFWLGTSDALLVDGVVLGVALALAALVLRGRLVQLAFALSTIL